MGWREDNAEISNMIYRIRMRRLILRMRMERRELADMEFRSWLMWERYKMELRRERLEHRYNPNHDSKGRFASGKGLTGSGNGAILKGGYDPDDIRQAITQEGTNFVTKDINDPESLYGALIEDVPSDGHYYDIKCHGAADSVKVFASVVDETELARIILYRNDYDGRPIRLLACETGKGKNCIAQKLADLLGVDVQAPTEIIWAKSGGKFSIGTTRSANDGKMKVFHPQKRSSRA